MQRHAYQRQQREQWNLHPGEGRPDQHTRSRRQRGRESGQVPRHTQLPGKTVGRGDHRQGVVGGSRSAEATRVDALANEQTDTDKRRRTRRDLKRAIEEADAERASVLMTRIDEPLERGEIMRLANVLYDAKMWSPAATVLNEIRRRFTDSPPRVALRRAEIAIRHEQRPAAALALLSSVAAGSMNAGEARRHAQLVYDAKRAAKDNPLEFADDAL